VEGVQQGLTAVAPRGQADVGGFAHNVGFDFVELGNAAHGFLGDRRFCRFPRLEEFPSRMSKAGDMRDPRRLWRDDR
jgi:hypothetical protein